MFNTDRFNIKNPQNLPKIPFKFYPKGYDMDLGEEVYRALKIREEGVNSSLVFVEYICKNSATSSFRFYYFPDLNSVVVHEFYPYRHSLFEKYELKGRFSDFIWNTFKNPDVTKNTRDVVKISYTFDILQDVINYFSIQNCQVDIDCIDKNTNFSDIYSKLPYSYFEFKPFCISNSRGSSLDILKEHTFIYVKNIMSSRVLEIARNFQRVEVDYLLKSYSYSLPYSDKTLNKGVLYFLALPVNDNAIYPIVIDYKGGSDYIVNTLEGKSIKGSKGGVISQDKAEQSLIELASQINNQFIDYIISKYV